MHLSLYANVYAIFFIGMYIHNIHNYNDLYAYFFTCRSTRDSAVMSSIFTFLLHISVRRDVVIVHDSTATSTVVLLLYSVHCLTNVLRDAVVIIDNS